MQPGEPTGPRPPVAGAPQQLSRWSWSSQRAAARQRAQRRRIRLSRGGGVALLAGSLALAAPLVYEFTLGDQQANHEAASATARLEQSWAGPTAAAGTPRPAGAGAAFGLDSTGSYPRTYPFGQTFAVLHIPRIGLSTAIAEGTDTTAILDHGLVGHYSGAEQTAYPWQSSGNFAIAAHRTTYGHPFQRLDEVRPGDEVVVETRYEFFVYRITGGIEQVPKEDVGVINPIPAGSGFSAPGRYLTMTTCTPEYTAVGRLVRFGRLVEVVPRSAQPSGLPTL